MINSVFVMVIVTADQLVQANALAAQMDYEESGSDTFTSDNSYNASGEINEAATHYVVHIPVKGTVYAVLKDLATTSPSQYRVIEKPDHSEFTIGEFQEVLQGTGLRQVGTAGDL